MIQIPRFLARNCHIFIHISSLVKITQVEKIPGFHLKWSQPLVTFRQFLLQHVKISAVRKVSKKV